MQLQVTGSWNLTKKALDKLCTFNTPFGRYRFLRVPFGIVSASKIFQRVMSQMVEDIDGNEAIMDDIVVWRKDQAEHDMCLKQVMDKAKACSLKFNKGKCKFWQPDFLCRTCIVWGRCESRSREDQSSSRHEATTEPDRTDDISWIHPISEEIHAQHSRHQCSSQKTDRRMLSGSGLRPKRTVSTSWRNWQQKLQYSGSITLHYLSHSQ